MRNFYCDVTRNFQLSPEFCKKIRHLTPDVHAFHYKIIFHDLPIFASNRLWPVGCMVENYLHPYIRHRLICPCVFWSNWEFEICYHEEIQMQAEALQIQGALQGAQVGAVLVVEWTQVGAHLQNPWALLVAGQAVHQEMGMGNSLLLDSVKSQRSLYQIAKKKMTISWGCYYWIHSNINCSAALRQLLSNKETQCFLWILWGLCLHYSAFFPQDMDDSAIPGKETWWLLCYWELPQDLQTNHRSPSFVKPKTQGQYFQNKSFLHHKNLTSFVFSNLSISYVRSNSDTN